jgi:hypothetical protein
MARQDSGKYVSRAGSTGGSRTYRAQIPYRWYSGLALIVILGVFLVAYSRYEVLHPQPAAAAIQPTTSAHWVAGLAFDVCGKTTTLAASPADEWETLSIYTSGSGVLQIQPKSTADSGTNTTVGLFSSSYKGLTLTSDSIALPKQKTLTNGEKCPSGTPDAGQSASLVSKVWSDSSTANSTTQSGDPRQVRWQSNTQMVTVAFVPNAASVGRDVKLATAVAEADNALIQSEETTTTTLPTAATTTTTAKGATTTTTPSGSTTTTTTTTSGSTTTTTASKATTTTTG